MTVINCAMSMYKFADDYPDPRVREAFRNRDHTSMEASNYALMLAIQDLTEFLRDQEIRREGEKNN